MPHDPQQTYNMIWTQENQFAYTAAKNVLDKPKISVWIILVPILFLYYAHKIQQYKAGVHSFGKGVVKTKILALDSALEEVKTGKKDESYKEAFVSKDLENSPNVMRVRDAQVAEVELLKPHFSLLLRQEGTSFQALIKKAYKTSGAYRFFLNQLIQAEETVQDAVLRAYHPSEEAQKVAKKMQQVMYSLREEEVRTIFGS